MPHNVIEYSQGIEQHISIPDLCKSLHQVVLDAGVFSAAAIKTRAKSYDVHVHGEDHAENPFIHVTCSILTGRDLDIRQKLSAALFEKAQQLLPEITNISVNVHEMDKETYRK